MPYWTDEEKLSKARFKAFQRLINNIRTYAPKIDLITVSVVVAEDIYYYLQGKETFMGYGPSMAPSMSWPNQWDDMKVEQTTSFDDDHHVMICYKCDVKREYNKHFTLRPEKYMDDK